MWNDFILGDDGMFPCAMFLENSLLVSESLWRWVKTGNDFEVVSCYWLLNRIVVKHVARGMLQYAMFKSWDFLLIIHVTQTND